MSRPWVRWCVKIGFIIASYECHSIIVIENAAISRNGSENFAIASNQGKPL